MLVFFSVTILILTAVVSPLMLTMKAGADLVGNTGYVRVYFYFIPVFYLSATFEHVDPRTNNIVISRHGKTEEIHLNMDKSDGKSITAFFKKVPLLSAVRVRNLTVDGKIGKSDDAMATTLALAAARTAFNAAGAFLKTRESVTIRYRLVPAYNANAFSVDLFGIISLSLANIIYSLLRAVKE